MSDSDSSLLSSHVPAMHRQYRELTILPPEDWENSVASSDQMDSLGDDDIRDVDS